MDIEARINGRVGTITLDRPQALNALNLSMVEHLDVVLADWAIDPAVHAVLIRSASRRAFCAGGDVRAIGILPGPAERMAAGRAFFGAEYRVNHRINTFPKPFIALINGIAMGGGLGLSVHGSHRVVSEDLRMAMPETAIGLFPDVGGTWFLNRCPGAIGRYLALAGPQIGAADALTARLATHHAPYAAFEALASALAAADALDSLTVDAIIDTHAVAPDGGALAERVLQDDFRMAVRMVGGRDFAEGVRANLVDKDMSPRWAPPDLCDVTEADIDALLAPLPEPSRTPAACVAAPVQPTISDEPGVT